MSRRLAGLLLLVSLFLAIFALWLRWELLTSYYGASTAEVFVVLPRGASSGVIAERLKSAGVIHRSLPFNLYVRWKGVGGRLQAGEYRFSAAARPAEIVLRLLKGDVFYRSVTIPEGLTAKESAALLAHAGIAGEKDLEESLGHIEWISDLNARAESLEGYLFPDTYRFPRQVTAEEVIKTMIAQFRAKISLLLVATPLPVNRELPDIITLASLIEKEARIAEERRLVASVMTNRLKLRMPLSCDPTIIYALKLAGSYDGNLSKADLAIASPYNTYMHLGLPPGPIANPGADAIQAALSPAQSDFLYYVSRNDGTHVFSRDLKSHLAAVARYQKRRARTTPR